MIPPLPTETYLKVWTPSDVRMSADARWVAYDAAEPMVEKPVSAVTVVEVATGKAHRIALGKAGASAPRFAPDGRTLFLRSGEDLYRVGVEGGRPRRAMTLPKGAGGYEVSPDGTQIAYTAPIREEPKKDGPRVVDADEVPTGLFVATLKEPRPRRLTGADETVSSFSWAPSGAVLAVGRTKRPNALVDETRFATLDPATGQATEIVGVRYPFGDFAVGPDGRTVAWTGPRGEGGPTAHDLFLRRPDGTVGSVSSDTMVDSIRFRPDGTGFGTYEKGFGGGIVELGADGAFRTVPVPGTVGTVDSPRIGAYAFTFSAPTVPPEVYVSLDGTPPRPLTHLNDALRPALVEPQRIVAVSFDGKAIESRIFLPVGRTVPPPLVALPHGGPTGRNDDHYAPWAQALVAHGYAVLVTNFRGSTGYGWDFATVNRGDWGGGDYRDIMASIDAAIAKGLVDKDRLGIFGWSYGGYMAAWAVGQTTRFKASIIGAPMTNLVSEFGTEGNGTNQYDAWFHGRAWDDLSGLLRQSPLVYAKNVRTPCLILQGEADTIDPVGQSQEFYRALRAYGVEAQLVLYPGEPHGFRKPKDRIDVLDRTISFLDAHVGHG